MPFHSSPSVRHGACCRGVHGRQDRMRSLVLPRQRDAPPKHAADAAYLRWDIWRAWALANLAAEALGLGATLLIGILVFGGLESRVGIIPVALLGVFLARCAKEVSSEAFNGWYCVARYL